MAHGTVRWFDHERGLGKLSVDDGPEVAVESAAVVGMDRVRLDRGDRVEFDVHAGPDGDLHAADVRPMNFRVGTPILLRNRTIPASAPAALLPAPTPAPAELPAPMAEPPWHTFGRALEDNDPRQLGRYIVRRRLGLGAMGTVFLAEAPTGAPVAIKVIRDEFAHLPSFRGRFRKEVANAVRVRSSRTAAVLDSVVEGDKPYLVTEFVDGPTLEEAVERDGQLSEAKLGELATQTAAALVAIHDADVIHRDLKPSNIILGSTGSKVIDFGIARSLEATATSTQSTNRMGTPAYMSPEQIETGRVDFSSDIFSWGGVLVYGATGAGPYGEGPPMALMFRIIEQKPNLDGVPEHLRPVVREAMARNPLKRPTALQLLDLLGEGDQGRLTRVDTV
jgi:cold shock CspA family protein